MMGCKVDTPLIIKSVGYDAPEGIVTYTLTHEYRCTHSALKLLERGNIWKLEHGEPLSFANLDEEAGFYKSLGMSQKVIFTDTESELWPFGGGIRELQHGRADQLIVKDRKNQEVVLIKYDNAEFGNRMRAAELARLGC
ncbi:MAG: hypothetical protein A3C13_04310 [Candidatus Lloydbacteria bacterium RIFCSPHIGHO2_02_FULL_50_11]|nr:MAG: hypothetical protein A3C13_04310 [Candidatus Lloydbacteria bacterium RIFCSPHIGHO2_02_FULL_50_11]